MHGARGQKVKSKLKGCMVRKFVSVNSDEVKCCAGASLDSTSVVHEQSASETRS